MCFRKTIWEIVPRCTRGRQIIQAVIAIGQAKNDTSLPWLVWLSGLDVVPKIFNSQSGHMPRLWAKPWVEGMQSHIDVLSPSLPLSLNIRK